MIQRYSMSIFACVLLAATMLPHSVSAQSSLYSAGISNTKAGIISIENGYINALTGDIHLEFPISNLKQRGTLQRGAKITYDSQIWEYNTIAQWQPDNISGSMSGWRFVDGADVGYVEGSVISSSPCSGSALSVSPWPLSYDTYGNYVYVDEVGSQHPFSVQFQDLSSCPGQSSEAVEGYAIDSSGYYIEIGPSNNGVELFDGSGDQILPSLTDHNGNYWTRSTLNDADDPLTQNSNFSIDTLGRTPVTSTTTGSSGAYTITYTVLTEGGKYVNYVVTTKTINYAGCSLWGAGGKECTPGTLQVVSSIQLPDGGVYSFQYDADLGEISSMTLPAGGVVSYQNKYLCIQCLSGEIPMVTQWSNEYGATQFSYIPANLPLYQCSANTVCWQGVEVTRPDMNDTVYTSGYNDLQWFTQVDMYTGLYTAATPLKILTFVSQYLNQITNKSVTLWDGTNGPISSSATIITDIAGHPSSEQKTDYYPGAPSGPVGTLAPLAPSGTSVWDTNYQFTGVATGNQALGFSNSGNYLSVVSQYYNNTIQSQAAFSYDQYPLVASNATNIQTISGSPGNLTGVMRGIPGNGTASISYIYDNAGQVHSATDANGNLFTLGYICNDAYLSSITYPNGLSSTVNPDCSSGAILSEQTSGNSSPTSYNYDNFGRNDGLSWPDGGGVSWQFPSESQINYTLNFTGVNSYATKTFDQFDNLTNTNYSDNYHSYYYLTNMQEDQYCIGDAESVSYSAPNVFTCKSYDALGRIKKITYPDSTQTTYNYSGNQVVVSDGDGFSRTYTYNAMNELISVIEPSLWMTIYTYDGLGDIVQIEQSNGNGTNMSRAFSYDSLGRMKSQTTPEGGYTSYNYDGNGNLISKVDARGISATYGYDALNRLLSKTYANDRYGTPSTCYAYDSVPSAISTIVGSESGFVNGHIVAEWTQKGNCPSQPITTSVITMRTYTSYDPAGNALSVQQCLLLNCVKGGLFSLSYQYNPSGRMLSASNGVGSITLKSLYDALGRLSLITSSWDDATHPGTILSSPIYDASGRISSALYGAGININKIYDVNGRIQNESSSGFIGNLQ